VFGIHCIGGIIGALATGILVDPALGGVGLPDYTTKPGELTVAAYSFGPAMLAQIKAVLVTLLWSGIGSAILYKVVDLILGLRATVDEEREGLDLADHGERAYSY
jgi:ammonium transporter, Amt family